MENEQRTYRNFFGDNLKIILAITCVVLAFLLFRQCNANQSIKAESESVREFLQDSIQYYRNEAGQLIAEKTALKGTSNKLKDENHALQILLSKQIDSTRQLTKLVENFKTVEAAGNITAEAEIKDVHIPFPEPVDFTFSRRWSLDTEYYEMKGFTTQIGTTINRLKLGTTISFALGDKKKSFFKTEYLFEATSSNPHVTITGLDGGTFTERRKRLGLSAYVGAGIGQNFSFEPQFGMGLTYTFLYF